LLPWIAAERAVRGAALVAVGVVVLSHLHADWGGVVRWLSVHLGLNPTGRLVSHTIECAHHLTVNRLLAIGVVSLAYGVIELVDGVGLWKRRRWTEYLTIVATSLLVPLEIYELAHHATLLKIGGLVVNLLIVAYLIRVLRRHEG
jgi:uncharacterized membrane protein (DUF2068 family)